MNSDFMGALPAAVQEHLHGASPQPVTAGESGASVWHYPQANAYLKVSRHDTPYPASRDYECLHWLAGRVPVPEVLAFATDEQYQYVLMSAVSGIHPMHDDLDWSPQERVSFLADAARRFHAVDPEGCPYRRSVDDLLAQVEQHLAMGWIREDLFEPQYQGIPPRQLFGQLLALRPADVEPVVIHGDLFPLNIVADPLTRRLNGFLDTGSCGLGDPYADLALIALAIDWHLGETWIQPFFAAYGIPDYDPQRLLFYQMLSEFF